MRNGTSGGGCNSTRVSVLCGPRPGKPHLTVNISFASGEAFGFSLFISLSRISVLRSREERRSSGSSMYNKSADTVNGNGCAYDYLCIFNGTFASV